MINSRKIEDLHQTIQRGVNELIKRSKAKGLDVLITQTLRDIEYQNQLYAQGRTTKGNIVTNARGGESFHNYGLAFDICKNIKGHEYDDSEFFKKVGEIWTEMGGMWGGNFDTFVDTPHFEFSGELTIKDLKNGKTLPIDTVMKWEETVVRKSKFLVDGKETDVNVIFYENKNYVELRELEKLGISVGYDSKKKMPIIASKTDI